MIIKVIYLMADEEIPPFDENKILKLTADNEKENEDEDEQEPLKHHPIALQELAKNKVQEQTFSRHTVVKENAPRLNALSEHVEKAWLIPTPTSSVRIPFGLKDVAEFLMRIFFKILDFVIQCCGNENVQNVALVILTVTLEIFTTLVLAVVAVFAAIIINVDDAYNRTRVLRFADHERPERQPMSRTEARAVLPAPRPQTLRVIKRSKSVSVKNAVEKIVGSVSETITKKESEVASKTSVFGKKVDASSDTEQETTSTTRDVVTSDNDSDSNVSGSGFVAEKGKSD